MLKSANPSAIDENAMLALYLLAEDDMQASITNFFSTDPERVAKLGAARSRCDVARDDWVACRYLRHLQRVLDRTAISPGSPEAEKT
jgi:hypothetical protein